MTGENTMDLGMTVNPSMVPAGNPATATLTIANGGDAVEVTDIFFVIDACLVDISTVRMTPMQQGWTVGAPLPQGTQVLFHATAPSAGVLFTSGAIAFFFQVSSAAKTGNIAATAQVMSAASMQYTAQSTSVPIPPVSISVTTQVAFTTLNLNPPQVGRGVPSMMSWDAPGAAQCVLTWTPALALTVQCGGQTSSQGASTMNLPASGQASLTPSASAHMTLTAIGSSQQRQEQLSLWLPDLALQVGSNPAGQVLDPSTPLIISYAAGNDPANPTKIILNWSGSSAYVTQNGAPLANGAQLAVPTGTITIVMSNDTTLTFVASTPSGLSTTAAYPLKLGAMIGITLQASGWYDCQMTVTAQAEGKTWSLDTGTLLLGQSSTLLVPKDCTSITAAVYAWTTHWVEDHTKTWPGTDVTAPPWKFTTHGTVFNRSVSEG
jgi:hypothetical protein